MAKDKKSFVAYCDWIDTFEALPDDKAGQLAKHLFRYVNDMNPETDDVLINAVFANIKQSLKRDLRKYESICDRNKKNGSKGGRPKKQEEPKKPSGLIGNPSKPQKADSDSDSDSVKEDKKEVYSFDEFWNLYPKKIGKKTCLSKFSKLSNDSKQKIKDTLTDFINHKPFQSYTHPNPETYLNQERWNDELGNKNPSLKNNHESSGKKHQSYADITKKDWRPGL